MSYALMLAVSMACQLLKPGESITEYRSASDTTETLVYVSRTEVSGDFAIGVTALYSHPGRTHLPAGKLAEVQLLVFAIGPSVRWNRSDMAIACGEVSAHLTAREYQRPFKGADGKFVQSLTVPMAWRNLKLLTDQKQPIEFEIGNDGPYSLGQVECERIEKFLSHIASENPGN